VRVGVAKEEPNVFGLFVFGCVVGGAYRRV